MVVFIQQYAFFFFFFTCVLSSFLILTSASISAMRVCGRVKCVRPKGFKQDIEHLSGVILAPGNVAKQPDANAALCLWGIMFA